MDDSEFEDFKNELERIGHKLDDFIVAGKEVTNWRANSIIPIQGTITVKRKSTNVERIYNAGNMSHWAIDCIKDLEHGLFGT